MSVEAQEGTVVQAKKGWKHRREERLFRRYVSEEMAGRMNAGQRQLLREEIALAYRYILPWHRSIYVRGLWHGVGLVEQLVVHSDEAEGLDEAPDGGVHE